MENNSSLQVSSDGPTMLITINRPEKRNAITHAMWRRLPEILADFETDDTARVLILQGAGSDFCVGADITEFDELRRDSQTARDYEAANSSAFSAFRHATKPTIAAVRGNCLGGGFGLAAACDLRFSTPDAVFSVPAAKLGLAYPSDAMVDIVGALGPQMAKYLIFSAARLSAVEAREAGFLMAVFDEDTFDQRIAELARTIGQNAPLTIRASKAAIRAIDSRSPEDIENAKVLGDLTFESRDYEEGRNAFRERRPPLFNGN